MRLKSGASEVRHKISFLYTPRLTPGHFLNKTAGPFPKGQEKQVRPAPTIRAAETLDRLRVCCGQTLGQPAFCGFRVRHDERPEHCRLGRKVVDVPVQGLVPSRVPGQSSGQVSLGAADVSIKAPAKVKLPKPTDANGRRLWQIEKRDVDVAVPSWARLGHFLM